MRHGDGMTKYKMLVAQHEYERGYKKKASILERELNSKTVVKECATMEEFTKVLDKSHSNERRSKIKRTLYKGIVYNKYVFLYIKKERVWVLHVKHAK